MSLKRTFGLVGDYGDSDSEGDTGPTESENKQSKNAKNEKIINIEIIHPPTVDEDDKKVTATKNDDKAEAAPVPSSKWNGVRQEYEDSSLMFRYIQDTEKVDEDSTKISDVNKSVEMKNSAEKAAKDALAAADAVLLTVSGGEKVGGAVNALDDPAAKAEYYKTVYEVSLKKEKEKNAREEAARDWEIKEIQREIEEERKKWEGAWSDDEGEGAETEAVSKDQNRRRDVLQAVIDEVAKTNKKPEETTKDRVNTKQGERWKRLQVIAEARVQSDPEKYITFPQHKFPLRE